LGRPRRHQDPYPLYAASNAGSLTGLLAYPFLLEPFTRLGTQTGLWSALYVALAVLVALLARAAVRAPAPAPEVLDPGPPFPCCAAFAGSRSPRSRRA
jgi:hypothetical protein